MVTVAGLVTDWDVNVALAVGGERVRVRAANSKYVLPWPLWDFVPEPGMGLWNDAKVRLVTDPTVDALTADKEVVLQQVGYFDQVACSFSIDAERLPALDDSQLANMVGVSILAVTSDGRIPLVRDRAHSHVAAGSYAASGSGSLNWSDAYPMATRPGGASLADVVRLGMLRALCTETGAGVGVCDVAEEPVTLTGLFRHLARGGKPEFVGVCRLTATSEVLAAAVPEDGFVDGVVFVDASLLGVVGPVVAGWEAATVGVLEAALRDVAGEDPVLSPTTKAAWVAAVHHHHHHRDHDRSRGCLAGVLQPATAAVA